MTEGEYNEASFGLEISWDREYSLKISGTSPTILKEVCSIHKSEGDLTVYLSLLVLKFDSCNSAHFLFVSYKLISL